MSKHARDLSFETFDSFIGKGISVVDFWAAWCGPCKIMGPIFEEVAGMMGNKFNFGKVDVDKEGELAQKFRVISISTLIFFKNGEVVDKVVGVLGKEELVDRLNSF